MCAFACAQIVTEPSLSLMKESAAAADLSLRIRTDRLKDLLGPMDNHAQQVTAAERLGISHSTLWRLLKTPDHTPRGEVIAAIVGNLAGRASFEDLFEVITTEAT
jgi:predicted DNA-binding protein (UPF0251 family)